MTDKFAVAIDKREPLIVGLSQMVHVDEYGDFEMHSAALGALLSEIMECSHCCNAIVAMWPEELMQLSPWMPMIGGTFPPHQGMSWFEWINSANF